VFGGLWFTATEFTPDAVQPPQTIDTTILPPPKPTPETPAPAIAPVAKQSNASEGKAAAKGMASQAKNSQGNNQSNNGKALSDGVAEQDKTGTGSGLGDAGENKGNQSTSTQAELPSGVPIAAKPSSEFRVNYQVRTTGRHELGGSAFFNYQRTGETYTADLKINASPVKLSAHSEGQARSDTLATTRFKDGYSLFGVGNGNEFKVDYTTNEFHSGKGGIQSTNARTLYDYLSAIAYLQSVLQQGHRPSTLTLTVGKRKAFVPVTVRFQPEETITTYENIELSAIPVDFNFPSGSIESIKIWFVPSKKSQPYEILLKVKGGTEVTLTQTSKSS